MAESHQESKVIDDLEDALDRLEELLERTYDQIHVLYGRLEEIKKRYNTACKENRRSFRYHLRLRIITLEGMINAFYEYACLKEIEAKKLRLTIYGEVSDDSSSDED